MSRQELLGEPRIAAAAGPSAPTANSGHDAIAREPGARLCGGICPAIVRSDDFQILDGSSAVGVVIFDAHIWEMHVAVDDREIMVACPPIDLMYERIDFVFCPPTFAMEVLEKPLIISLQFVIQDDPMNTAAARLHAVGGVKVRAIQTRIVRQLSRLDQAGIKRLLAHLPRRSAVRLEQVAPTFGERDKRLPLSPDQMRHGAHETGFAKSAQVAIPRVDGPPARLLQIPRWHYAECPDSGQ
jgi:hypothetical protein